MSDDELYEDAADKKLVARLAVASGARTLEPERRLLRAQLAQAIADGDMQLQSYALEMLIKAVKADTGPSDSALSQWLAEASAEVVGQGGPRLISVEGKVVEPPPEAPPRPKRSKRVYAPAKTAASRLVGLTMGEAAAMIGISERSLQRLVRSGRLQAQPSPTDRRKRLIPREDVETYIKECAADAG